MRTSTPRDSTGKNKPFLERLGFPPNYQFELSTTKILLILLCTIIALSIFWSSMVLDDSKDTNINIPLVPNDGAGKEMNDFLQESVKDTTKKQKRENIDNLQFSLKFNNFNPENGNEHIKTLDDLKYAIKLSLTGYILRPGHDKRVEYLIGTRDQNKINDISTLPTRPTKQHDRDLKSNPIAIRGWTSPDASELPCDIPCGGCGNKNCDVQGLKWSMENVGVTEQPGYISGNTKLSSQVPVPYFSWHDFGFMAPMPNQPSIESYLPNQPSLELSNYNAASHKTSERMCAAFISNCGFAKRNAMVTDLQKYGVTIHSYGKCVHNAEENRSSCNGRDHCKVYLLSTHKFSLAFENSETDDYITEKFFQTLSSGAVPVYIGSPNVKFFAPDSGPYPYNTQHSVIYAGDFNFDAKKLAQYLLYLDKNDTAYNEYLRWKIEGYSGDFKAMVELTSTHTACRQCVLGGDRVRLKDGVTAYDEPKESFEYGEGKIVYVRERGRYRFSKIRLERNSLEGLVSGILMSLKKHKVNMWSNNEHPDYERIGPAVYAIYHVPSKTVIHSDEAVGKLPDGVELECILV